MAKVFEPKLYIKYIQDSKSDIISSITFDEKTGKGKITYNPKCVNVDPEAPDFKGTTTNLNDEEMVRAVLLLKLEKEYGYKFENKYIDIEKVYEAPGRPKKGAKGSRSDIVIRNEDGSPFLYFELKTPQKYISERYLIKGQLFQSSKLEKIKRPDYLLWTTVVFNDSGEPAINTLVISTSQYGEYDKWQDAGEPAGNAIPKRYGTVIQKSYARVPKETETSIPLDETSDELFFKQLTEELHNVIWGGGGTNNNDVFAVITKLFLCKIYDEKEIRPGNKYEFQVNYIGNIVESPDALVDRMNVLYKKAESSYLLDEKCDNVAFDKARIKPSKVFYVVQRLEGISLTKNVYGGDLLGSFFEEIVAHGFTQTKGQFFTPVQLVEFMTELCDITEHAKRVLVEKPDGRGIHRMPNVIDPSCGVGTFLIVYMKSIVKKMYENGTFKAGLSDRALETFEAEFSGQTHTNWAKRSLFAIENNYDLGLAAKVNMILHGDGSMNTFVTSGLLPFSDYCIQDRPTILEMHEEYQNEKFDIVLSNPPFSLKLTPDEKKSVEKAFSGELKISEDLFIERWYQLLRPEQGVFCCVLPESVCDTPTELDTRIYLLSHFKIKAIISLPYLTFKPYTSVKTCVIYAEKRSTEQVNRIEKEIKESGWTKKEGVEGLKKVFDDCGLLDEKIFMAEPQAIGYKRRKGLSDLITENDLPKVLFNYRGNKSQKSLRYGFETTLKAIFSRSTLRLDAKYRWLWDVLEGKISLVARGAAWNDIGNYVKIVELNKIKKGDLAYDRKLIDLDSVYPLCGGVNYDEVPEVSMIGSDKVEFSGADLVVSKLEPYLGKCIINPEEEAIGTTEWVGLKCKKSSPRVVGYLLSLPQMREAMRMLQSGKRHARMDAKELLQLKINIDLAKILEQDIQKYEEEINSLKNTVMEKRRKIDDLYSI